MIIAFGQRSDPHINAVLNHIEQQGGRLIVIDPLLESESTSICINTESSEITLEAYGDLIEITEKEINSFWWRMKPNLAQSNYTISQISGKNFTDREWVYSIESLEFLYPSISWVNSRDVDRKISRKPLQLHLASKAGFRVPRTLITNRASEIIKTFSDSGLEVIYKALSWYIDPPNKILYTNKLSVDDIHNYKDNIQVAPGIFQEHISKLYELRITIVGTDIFSVKIDSQSNPDAILDWRRKQFDLNYELCELPSSFATKLISFHQLLGLKFGAYDFIVTPNYEYVFLEVNPVGQWLWIENATGIPISKALAQILMNTQ